MKPFDPAVSFIGQDGDQDGEGDQVSGEGGGQGNINP